MALYHDDSVDDAVQREMILFAVRFIEGVLRDSVTHILETTGKTQDEVLWSVTIGVPVEVRKTPKEALFASIASRACEAVGLSDAEVHAIPEIQAGLVSFTASNEIAPGYYAAFDIGGGTVDASMFAVNKREGQLLIEFLSGSVKATGAEELTRSLRDVLSMVDPARTYDPQERAIRIDDKQLVNIAEKVHKQTATVLASAPAKSMYHRYEKQAMIYAFMIGGGAQIRWYPQEIKHTHPKHQLGRAGVPRIEFREVPHPNGFELDSQVKQKHRFFIAYGLSFYPEGTRVEVVGFPSQYSDEEFAPVYQDYRDKLYQHAMEGYGETI
ncbi:MAG: hypothetical protein PF508_22285 [Spirochaeta sp.]|nr:hypothetical protein [Spirochaeta sp.]